MCVVLLRFPLATVVGGLPSRSRCSRSAASCASCCSRCRSRVRGSTETCASRSRWACCSRCFRRHLHFVRVRSHRDGRRSPATNHRDHHRKRRPRGAADGGAAPDAGPRCLRATARSIPRAARPAEANRWPPLQPRCRLREPRRKQSPSPSSRRGGRAPDPGEQPSHRVRSVSGSRSTPRRAVRPPDLRPPPVSRMAASSRSRPDASLASMPGSRRSAQQSFCFLR